MDRFFIKLECSVVASDELARGRSTFMVEMSEASDILTLATPKTLVILDECMLLSVFIGSSILMNAYLP
jgi:DNA mismatch repair ATPase MutS